MQTPFKNSIRLGSPWLAGALCPCLLLALGAHAVAVPRAGKARKPPVVAAPTAVAEPSEAEFEVVAAGDELYRLLATVQRGGLLQSAPRGGATRYEMALETGRAALALASKRASRARVSEDSARALSDLLTRLRPELRRLDVDVDAALVLCRASGGTDAPVSALLSSTPGSNRLKDGRASGSASSNLMAARQSLSSKLRLTAVRDSWDRRMSDPFGGETGRSPSFFGAPATNRSGAAFFDRPRVGPQGVYSAAQGLAVGASLDIFSGVRVRTGYNTSAPSLQPSSLRALGANSPEAALLAPGSAARRVGVGAEVDLPAGLRLSGDVQRLGNAAGGFEGTSIGGQARISAFNDRLSLSLNMSRLVPEERANLSQRQSMAGVGVAVGNSDLQFKLLYQQLFGPSSGQSNRVIAGGVNITF